MSEKKRRMLLFREQIPSTGIVADASCIASPRTIERDGYFHGRVEWQLFDLERRAIIHRSCPYERSTINLGEFCAVVDALRILHDRGEHRTPVYSDSRTACSWIRKRAIKTKLPENPETLDALFAAWEAVEWLKKAMPRNPVQWWNTPQWGESPADFGRK